MCEEKMFTLIAIALFWIPFCVVCAYMDYLAYKKDGKDNGNKSFD